MYKRLKIVKIDSKYCDYLRQFENKVSYNAGSKELRPFVGVLFMIGKCEYFAPLSSPKNKHKMMRNQLDLYKIKNGDYGVINFNNMIPVTKKNYEEFNLNENSKIPIEQKRIILMRNQAREINKKREDIYKKSKLLYNLYKNNRLSESIKKRCCNFILLEEKSKEYNKKD